MSLRQNRILSSIIYLAIVLIVHWAFVGVGFPLDQRSLWLFNGVASLVLGSRIVNPHFVPPVDVLTNSFLAGATVLAALAAKPETFADLALCWAVFAYCLICFSSSLVLMLVKRSDGSRGQLWVQGFEKVLRSLGAPNSIFTVVILLVVWVFHRNHSVEMFVILATWTAIVTLDPVDAALDIATWWRSNFKIAVVDVVGEIVAHQMPGLVLIRQKVGASYALGTLFALSDDKGPVTLGVALNYVGRDDGILLRALSLPVPAALQAQVKAASVGAKLASRLILPQEVEVNRQSLILDRISSLCGIVDSNSSLNSIEVEIVNDHEVSEGRLVETKVQGIDTIFQIISGTTTEEFVQQKNKYGYVRATARKIGQWDAESRSFKQASWLPKINAPVFLLESEDFKAKKAAIGHFPRTNFEVSIDISDAVTHNTAILGILGVGKSFLASELVERMAQNEIKVVCLDLTDQYGDLIRPYTNDALQNATVDKLRAAAAGRPVRPGKEEGGSIAAFSAACRVALDEFLNPENKVSVLILNPASFEVSRQTTNAYQGAAAFTNISSSEITAIISEAALAACQSMGMTVNARLCLVYEEAHTLVPEWNSVASEGDKHATAVSARAILQGRKYGLGCLLITQRTANVTKTILNQCNTIFALRTYDDTGKDFLSNYIGADYAGVLPTLKDRHAVFFGKASSCKDPVLIRLNDRDSVLEMLRTPEAAVEPNDV